MAHDATAATKRQAAKAPECSTHGDVMVRVEGHTPEQKFCGEWFRCPRCTSSVLRPSAELALQVSPPPATDPRVEQYIRQENSRRGIW